MKYALPRALTFLVGVAVGLALAFTTWPVRDRAVQDCYAAARVTHDWDTLRDCLVARYGWSLERANDATTAMAYLLHPAEPAGDPMGARRPVRYQ